MTNRDPRARLLALTSVLWVGYASFVGCGSTDSKLQTRPDEASGAGGEGGEPGSGARPSGGAGNGNGNGNGNGGAVLPEGGAGGKPGGEGGANAPDTGGRGDDQSGNGGAAGALIASAGSGGEGGADPGCVPTQGSRITLGFDTNNAEWVKELKWLDNAGVMTANLAASGGPLTCNVPPEFFGQAYGAPEGTTPGIVVATSRATRTACGLDVFIASAETNCGDAAQLPWTTEYHFYDGAKASQLRVTRTFGFDGATPKFTAAGLRPWQARVPYATFGTVIYPNAASTAVTTRAVTTCPGDCFYDAAVWNGQWFANTTATGLAVIVRRDPSMTAPVSLTINYDSYSASNLTSFVLVQPAEGWKEPVTEVEYLCLADLTSWPQTERDAAQLPAFCGP